MWLREEGQKEPTLHNSVKDVNDGGEGISTQGSVVRALDCGVGTAALRGAQES